MNLWEFPAGSNRYISFMDCRTDQVTVYLPDIGHHVDQSHHLFDSASRGRLQETSSEVSRTVARYRSHNISHRDYYYLCLVKCSGLHRSQQHSQ